jgi:CheY-like chemotaxis protein
MAELPADGMAGCDVLVVEDDGALRRLFAAALRRSGLSMLEANDGAEALDLLRAHEFQVMILDLMMPRTSGWDVISWLAGHPERKPRTVIVVSAVDREVLRELDPSVVNAIVFKPFEVDVLTRYIDAACRLAAGADRRIKRIVSHDFNDKPI